MAVRSDRDIPAGQGFKLELHVPRNWIIQGHIAVKRYAARTHAWIVSTAWLPLLYFKLCGPGPPVYEVPESQLRNYHLDFPRSPLVQFASIRIVLVSRKVGASLSAEAHVLLYQSLSAFLLPPKLLEGNMGKVSELSCKGLGWGGYSSKFGSHWNNWISEGTVSCIDMYICIAV